MSSWNKNILQHKQIADENRVTQRQFIETTNRERSKQFEQKVKKMYQEVEDLQLLSEIRDTTRIDHLKDNMSRALGKGLPQPATNLFKRSRSHMVTLFPNRYVNFMKTLGLGRQ